MEGANESTELRRHFFVSGLGVTGFINTTAYHLGRWDTYILLLMSAMSCPLNKSKLHRKLKVSVLVYPHLANVATVEAYLEKVFMTDRQTVRKSEIVSERILKLAIHWTLLQHLKGQVEYFCVFRPHPPCRSYKVISMIGQCLRCRNSLMQRYYWFQFPLKGPKISMTNILGRQWLHLHNWKLQKPIGSYDGPTQLPLRFFKCLYKM